MKKLLLYILSLFLSFFFFLFFSCQKKNSIISELNQSGEIFFSSSINNLSNEFVPFSIQAESKSFSGGAKIGVFAIEVGKTLSTSSNYINNAPFTFDAQNNKWTGDKSYYYPADGTKLTFYAYYPYSSSATNPLSINLESDQTKFDALGFMLSEPITKDKGFVNFVFTTKMAIVELKATQISDDTQILSVKTAEKCNLAEGEISSSENTKNVKMSLISEEDASYIAFLPAQNLNGLSFSQGDLNYTLNTYGEQIELKESNKYIFSLNENEQGEDKKFNLTDNNKLLINGDYLANIEWKDGKTDFNRSAKVSDTNSNLLINIKGDVKDIRKIVLSQNGMLKARFDIFEAAESASLSVLMECEGIGTLDNPYKMASSQNFLKIKNKNSAYYVQSCDIDFNGKQIDPLANFYGTYDGQNKIIDNFKIESTKSTGLFVILQNNAYLKNMIIGTKSSIKSTGGTEVGAFCSRLTNAELSNCINRANVEGLGSVGGICGRQLNSKIDKCKNYGNIESSLGSYIGGICGRNDSGDISNCFNYGSITGKTLVGGICGRQLKESTTISQCYNKGTIKCIDEYGGGICGRSAGAIDMCISEGELLFEKSFLGGICGYIETTSSISNCLSSIIIKHASLDDLSSNSVLGGICGSNTNLIKNCISLCKEINNGKTNVGSICGLSSGNIEKCLYLQNENFQGVGSVIDDNSKTQALNENNFNSTSEVTINDSPTSILNYINDASNPVWFHEEGSTPTLLWYKELVKNL